MTVCGFEMAVLKKSSTQMLPDPVLPAKDAMSVSGALVLAVLAGRIAGSPCSTSALERGLKAKGLGISAAPASSRSCRATFSELGIRVLC